MVELKTRDSDGGKERDKTPQKVHILGASGLVFAEYSSRFPVESTPRSLEVDITRYDSVSRWAEASGIGEGSNIVLASAFTDAKGGEKERGDIDGPCFWLNARGPRIVAQVAQERGASLTLISTGFVFNPEVVGPIDEAQVPEDDETRVSWYGYTKFRGEEAAKEVVGGFKNLSIVRFDYPFTAFNHPKMDNARRIVTLHNQGKDRPAFKDQTFAPSTTWQIQDVVKAIADNRATGVFHVASSDRVDFKEWGEYILYKVTGEKFTLPEGSLAEYRKVDPFANFWPMNGGLQGKRTEEVLGIKMQTWKEQVDEFARRLVV